MTKAAAPSAPATNKANLYLDTTDFRYKQIDSNGVISVLPNDGLQDRNILTNGGFNIQQRVAAASTAIAGISTTTRAGQVADRWAITASTASNLNWQQVDTFGSTETGLLARYYGQVIKSSAAKKVMISQWILNSEMAHLRGQRVRVSVKTNIKTGNAQTLKLGLIQLTAAGTVDTSPAFLAGAWSAVTGTDPSWGTNLSAITPDASPTPENATISGNYALIAAQQTTWVRSSACWTVPVTAKNLVVVLFSDDAGGNGDIMAYAEFQLTQGLEIVDYVEPPLAETLIRCQRFYCNSFPLGVTPAAAVAVATGGFGAVSTLVKAGSGTAQGSVIPIEFPVVMWKAPTMTYFTPVGAGAAVYRHTGATPAVQGVTATLTNSLTPRGVVVTATNEATANGVVGDIVSVHYAADAEFVQ